jgi:branched-chain amino acid transport system permease protein
MSPSSSLTAAVVPSIPFAVTAIFLVYFLIRRGRISETEGVGGALDRAIAVRGDSDVKAIASTSERPNEVGAATTLGWRLPILGLAIVAVLPFILHGFWIGLVAQGVAFGIIFLSFSLVVGEGGMVWLCMATFAGVGGLATGQLATSHGWPVLAAVFMGGLIALPIGVVIGLLTIRLGTLYVALVTLTFGLLMENLVFSRSTFLNQGIGVNLNRPSFAQGDRAFTYLGLIVFVIVALFIVNIRRSTTGLALTAVRWTEPAAKTIGISVLQMKVIIAGLASFVAGIGGGLVAVEQGVALPSNYATLVGVVWLAVLVTQGIRSNVAALIAGLFSTILPGIALSYLPTSFGQFPPILFGLGAIALARNPDGVLAMQARQIRTLALRFRKPTAVTVTGAPVGAEQPEVGLGVGR